MNRLFNMGGARGGDNTTKQVGTHDAQLLKLWNTSIATLEIVYSKHACILHFRRSSIIYKSNFLHFDNIKFNFRQKIHTSFIAL